MTKLTVDIAVMGSGLAGISAAVTAARKGAKVAVFEKRPFQGGSVSNTPIGLMIIKGEKEYQDKAFNAVFKYTNYNGNPKVIQSWIKNAYRMPEFCEFIKAPLQLIKETPLEDIGTEHGNQVGFPEAINNIGDTYFMVGRGKGHGGAVVCYQGMKKLRELGGELYVDTSVTELIQENGIIAGLKAKHNKTGEEYEVTAKAVIIASGGFGENPEMVKELTGHTATDANCSNGGNVVFNYFPGCRQVGEGQKLVWKAGGAKGSTGVCGHNVVPGPGIIGNTPWIVYNETRTIQEQPYLWVNQHGERFINESQSLNHNAMGLCISNQPDKCGYILFDEDTKIHMETDGVEFVYFIFPVQKLTNVTSQFEELIKVKKNKHIFMTDTIEELCEQTGINKAGLKATIDQYNGYCDKGSDEEFSKEAKYLRPVKRGPFYAMRVFNGGYSTTGGIKINGRCEVVNEEGWSIPGLYSAGDCAAGEIYGNPPLGGAGNAGTALSHGFVSADSALEYVGIS